jgi:hypothetical protein
MKTQSTIIYRYLIVILFIAISGCQKENPNGFGIGVLTLKVDVASIDSLAIIEKAELFLDEKPITVTNDRCERSLGGKNDFYSEGDYWWPNPENPNGPYYNRDGMTNPDNFTAHRKAMRRMSIQVVTLAAAYKITGDSKYASPAADQLRAWFVNPETRMNPHMRFAQAIKGVVSGRGVGLIDGIHLVEPARAVSILEKSEELSSSDIRAIKDWYTDFLQWMNTHDYGIDERERKNNHGTCWVMQAAEYARLTENEEMLAYCRNRYKTVLLPNQMSEDGSFHMELKRTKPYGYSLFNIDAMAMVCHILSTPEDNLWNFKLAEGQGMEKGMEFIVPYIANKSSWNLPPDIMFWDQWPVRHPSLLFAGAAYNNMDYINLWKSLPRWPDTEEGMRNFPIRQPVLWMN